MPIRTKISLIWIILKELLLNTQDKNTIVCINVKPWKRKYIEKYFEPTCRFLYIPNDASNVLLKHVFIPKIIKNSARVYCWGKDLPKAIRDANIPICFVEDGFIRSLDLGSKHTPPLSLVFDHQTVYFDAKEPSDLEDILNNYDFSDNHELMSRSKNLRKTLLKTGISKYNHIKNLDIAYLYGKKTRNRVLVIGQVEDDASIKYGCYSSITNNDLIRLALAENPTAQVIYKPHPDIIANKRKRKTNPFEFSHRCQILDFDVPLTQSFEGVDHVYTITSLAGFEALLRGIKVTTLGCPFYSGWGLTDDRQLNPRRLRKLTIDEVLAGAYILYPKYFDFDTNRFVQVEDVVKKIVQEKR